MVRTLSISTGADSDCESRPLTLSRRSLYSARFGAEWRPKLNAFARLFGPWAKMNQQTRRCRPGPVGPAAVAPKVATA
jgi:hypothetical protein